MDDIIENTSTEAESSAAVERTTQDVISEQLEMFDEENIAAVEAHNEEFNPKKEGSHEQEQHQDGNSESSLHTSESTDTQINEGSDDGRSETQNVQSEDGNSQQLGVLESPEYTDLQARYEKVAPAEGFLTYIEEQGLSEDDVHRALELATLYNTDPEKALEYFQPLVNDLNASQGGYLYPEIQDLVDEGEMTEAAAFKYQESLMTQARYQETEQNQQRAVQQQEQQQAQQEEQQASLLYQELQNNANNWEAMTRKSDLDYDAPLFEGGNTKGQEVLMTVTHMVNTQGYPNDIAAQNNMLKAAYESVNLKINRLRGGKRMPPPPSSSNSSRAAPMGAKLTMGQASTKDIISQLMGLTG